MIRTNTTGRRSVPAAGGIATKSAEQLAAEREAAELQLKAIQEQEQRLREAAEQEEAEKRSVREGLYREMVERIEQTENLSMRSPNDYTRQQFAAEALELRRQLKVLFPDFVAAEAKVEVVAEVPHGINRPYVLRIIAAFVGTIAFFAGAFEVLRQKIALFNATLSIENGGQAMPAYGWDSFQRLAFLGLTSLVVTVVAGSLLAIVNPSVLKYVLPFWRGSKNSEEEFLELKPNERQWISALYVVGLLFCLAVIFAGKA